MAVEQFGSRSNGGAAAVKRRAGAKPDPVGVIIAEVIAEVLDGSGIRGADRYHRIAVGRAEAAGLEPPALSRFQKAFRAERARRRAIRRALAEEVAAKVVSVVSTDAAGKVSGGTPVDAATYGIVVASIIAMNSVRVGDAHGDYCDAARRVGAHPVPEADYRAIVYSAPVVDVVPRELMPDWWRRQLARTAR